MNIIGLSQAKNYANQVALGISDMVVVDTTITFTIAATGETAKVTVPTPKDGKDGISITDVRINANREVIVTFSDGSTTIAGVIPVVKGDKGEPGENGVNGLDGKSAYQIALDNGFVGTEQEWLDSLRGTDSKNSTLDTSACKIIAHRGYHVNSYQNTIAAFKEAIVNGFKYLEIDIRKTMDGVYILSHDDTITLYNTGVSTSVTISKSNYSDIRSYTWDPEGQCILNTLHSLFNSMKIYDVILICDRKSGTNAEIVELANLCGVTDRLLLSYSSISSAISDADLLNKYDNIPLRIVPSDYAKLETLAETISNPIYADVNASMADHYRRYLNYAFTAGMPILFSGCSLSNKNVWAQVASGCMSNDNDNISYSEFKDVVTGDYDRLSDLTSSTTLIETELTNTVTITASTTIDNISGNIYAYSKNPLIAEVEQTKFGNSVTINVVPKMIGETTVVIFDGVGGNIQIPVTIINSTVEEPTLGIQTNVGIVKKCSISGTDIKVYGNAARMIAVSTTGLYPLYEGNNVWDGSRFPIAVPEGASKVIITCEGYVPGILCLNYNADTTSYTKVVDSGWQTANNTTYDLTSVDCDYIAINFKNTSNSNIGDDADVSGIAIEFA